MAQWKPVPIGENPLLTNIQEAILGKGSAALENCFSNEAGGLTQFPGMQAFSTLNGSGPTYLHEWRGDLMAVTSGQMWRIDRAGNAENVTKVPVSGGGRVIMDRTENELVASAGGQIVRFAGKETEILSEAAPRSTHALFIDGYLIAIEKDSGRFYHCAPGEYRSWDPIDVFSAEGRPDDINAAIVTPFRELLLTGIDSIEQFERLPSGDTPFFRRWAVGEGIFAPYTLVFADNATWGVTRSFEFVRMSGQTSQSAGDTIGQTLEAIDDWSDAWATTMNIAGQKFIVLQMPKATNAHDSRGVTCLFDYRRKRWFNLYGWDETLGAPRRWPGWSYYQLWGRHFVGGDGRVMELLPSATGNGSERRRVLGRSGHLDWGSDVRVEDVRIKIKRGGGNYEDREPKIRFRCRRDAKDWTRWKEKGLGRHGDSQQTLLLGGMGIAGTFQFEWEITDAAEAEMVAMDVLLTPVAR